MVHPPFSVEPVRSSTDLAAAARLFEAYACSLGIDLAYQDFGAELATLPGKYAPPAGALLLAHDHHARAVGCVALRPLAPDGCCELKRLFVAPEARGHGLGRLLLDAVVAAAVRIGYREIRLDTLPDMTDAIALYRRSGFTPIEPYYVTPVAGTVFLGRTLRPSAGA